jgi:diguanylate cyclase (GGDEF)-like protein/PAS domain S-box-containing protein
MGPGATARELAERVQLLTTIVDASGDAILATDLEGRITTWNDGATELYGWTREEAIGQLVTMLVPPELHAELPAQRAVLDAGGTFRQVETFRRHRDGRDVPVILTLSLLRDVDGRTVGYTALARDVTERHRFETALAASEARFRALVQHSADVAAIVDEHGRIRYLSRSDPYLGGHLASALTGSDGWELVHPEDQPSAQALFAEVTAQPGEHRVGELRIAQSDGTWRWVEAAATNLLHEPAVEGIVLNVRDIARRKAAEATLFHRAHHDQLTGLPNRAYLLDLLGDIGRTEPVAMLLLDVDEFKLINDTHGHAVGDTLLRLVATRLRNAVRDGDTVARLGGDEFVVVCPGIVDAADAVSVAEQIHLAFEPPFDLAAGARYFLHATIGIAIGEPGLDASRLLADADAAMYEAKRRGRGGHRIFDETLRVKSAARLAVEADLRAAVESGSLRCHYQPIVDLRSGMPVGVEALARWHHPQRGVLLPADWVPIADSSSLMLAVGRVLIEQAANAAAQWVSRGRGVPVAVNLSGRQLLDEALPDVIEGVLRRTGLPPGLLSFEVTEHAVLTDPVRAVDVMGRLQELGVRFSLDDFGTGYSSLAYLKQLPVELVKIDPSFIRGVARDWNDRGIVQAVVQLGRMLGRTVLAEGVEDRAQWAVLRAIGCQLGQGFHWSPAVPADEVPDVLAALEARSRHQRSGAPDAAPSIRP